MLPDLTSPSSSDFGKLGIKWMRRQIFDEEANIFFIFLLLNTILFCIGTAQSAHQIAPLSQGTLGK